ncbi:MAG: DUF6252 family protein [Bacteroidota bacterium]
MKTYFTFLFLFIVFLHAGCDFSESVTEPAKEEQNTETADVFPTGNFCIPPLTVDTSTAQLQMTLDNTEYVPLGNFTCVLPNIFLGIDQIWINGSTPPALKVVTLMMPTDIQVGTYNLILNTEYDARYVPSGTNNFLVDSGTLTIVKHDQNNRYIEGGFEFTATNIDSPVLPTVSIEDGCFQATY